MRDAIDEHDRNPTPDQHLPVFVSSTLGELAQERQAVSHAMAALRMTPVMRCATGAWSWLSREPAANA